MFINLRRPMLTSIDMLSSAEWLQQADKKMRPEKRPRHKYLKMKTCKIYASGWDFFILTTNQLFKWIVLHFETPC